MSNGKIRITIEIENEQVTSTTLERMPSQEQAPPELARAAAAIGAISAGSAPVQPPTAVQLGEVLPDAPEAADMDGPLEH